VHPVALVFQQKSQINFLCSQLIVSLLWYYIVYSKDEISCEQRKLTCDFHDLNVILSVTVQSLELNYTVVHLRF
jgi:hypothetical protein